MFLSRKVAPNPGAIKDYDINDLLNSLAHSKRAAFTASLSLFGIPQLQKKPVLRRMTFSFRDQTHLPLEEVVHQEVVEYCKNKNLTKKYDSIYQDLISCFRDYICNKRDEEIIDDFRRFIAHSPDKVAVTEFIKLFKKKVAKLCPRYYPMFNLTWSKVVTIAQTEQEKQLRRYEFNKGAKTGLGISFVIAMTIFVSMKDPINMFLMFLLGASAYHALDQATTKTKAEPITEIQQDEVSVKAIEKKIPELLEKMRIRKKIIKTLESSGVSLSLTPSDDLSLSSDSESDNSPSEKEYNSSSSDSSPSSEKKSSGWKVKTKKSKLPEMKEEKTAAILRDQNGNVYYPLSNDHGLYYIRINEKEIKLLLAHKSYLYSKVENVVSIGRLLPQGAKRSGIAALTDQEKQSLPRNMEHCTHKLRLERDEMIMLQERAKTMAEATIPEKAIILSPRGDRCMVHSEFKYKNQR